MESTTLQKARRWCAAQYKARRPERYSEHPSHLAREIMREAEIRYGLDTFGTEGFGEPDNYRRTCPGVSYLNTGETYAKTIVFWHRSERFGLRDWGSIAEANPSWS